MANELQAHYYRDNFRSLSQTVQAQYGDLLNAGEQDFLRRFEGLSFDAQCLYIRLVSRVGPWFREYRLAYAELGSITDAIDQLLEARFLGLAEALCVADLGQLYTVAELKLAFRAQLPSRWRAGKIPLLGAIDGLGLSGEAFLAMATGADEARVITPLGMDTVAVLQLLFFGNRYQSLTDFVLSDLGVARYYGYPLNREQRLFSSRSALDEYLYCAGLGDQWRELEGGADLPAMQHLAESAVTLSPEHSSTLKRWYRLCNSMARELERRGAPEVALALYEVSNRHPARERRARVLEGLKDYPAALAQCEAILESPWGEAEQEAAQRIMPRVQRKVSGAKVPRHRDRFESFELCLDRGEGSVERLAAQHLAGVQAGQPEEQWRAVHYVENTLMNGLFGLAR